MSMPEKIEYLIKNLPDAESARRFYLQFAEKFPVEIKKLLKNEALLSDVLTLASFSQLLAATIMQNPDYIAWLKNQRNSENVRGKEELLESLERFALLNSEVEPNILLARFRRRELLRIYLRDIRRLETIAEITEEISGLADAILEYALGIARQELDNRYGTPLEVDKKGRARRAEFCIVALGKLGSNELNYASDIDLLFLYSKDGKTSGQGARGAAVTNREYFVKLAEFITKLAGGQAGEGAAYRIDLRLRPNGRVGSLAISLDEAVSYYQQNAQPWERQVLIRSRACAGAASVFQKFIKAVEPNVFSVDETVENALRNVRLSKEKINVEKTSDRGFNVKLGKGGIREIEFIAQALQLARGGQDEWLREPHTLISLNRLADRGLISDAELTELFDAYEFLRRLEHRLQMENGLQTHLVPNEPEKRSLTARRMNFDDVTKFDAALNRQSANVNKIFNRLFGNADVPPQINIEPGAEKISEVFRGESHDQNSAGRFNLQPIFSSLEKSDFKIDLDKNKLETLEILSEITPPFAEMLAANPGLIEKLPNKFDEFQRKDYRQTFLEEIKNDSLARDLAALRKNWSRFLLEIVVFDVLEKTSRRQTKQMQTRLAQASIEFALQITKSELEKRFSRTIDNFSLSVLGLGKLGGGGMDYGSDLDLILIYDEDENSAIESLTAAEFYARAVEIFVTTLSALTREGHLYRVDLRLRPDGKNGATSLSKSSFLNYLQTRAAIWEWLAYVKIRGIAGKMELANFVETEARRIIHGNAQESKIQDSDFRLLKDETRRVRERLEQEKAGRRKSKEVDIKFGAGGMLDIYFAVRFLQLRHNLPDDAENRSTDFMLQTLRFNNFLNEEDFQNFSNGYEFLSELDHNLRLTVGRSTQLPNANQKALNTIVKRMKLGSAKELTEKLTVHRLEIRESFENIFK